MSVDGRTINEYLSTILVECPEDPSWNGWQVQSETPIEHVYGAVDASEHLLNSVTIQVPSLFIVHHGMFWKNSNPSLYNSTYRKVKTLLDAKSSLYASHLPLDIHPEMGNSISLLRYLSPIEDSIESFCQYKGYNIGYKGLLHHPVDRDSIRALFKEAINEPVVLLPFGKKEIHTVCVCSGDGTDYIHDAVHQKQDLFITGEFSHTMYVYAQDHGINVMCLTHYGSEKYGVLNLCEKLQNEFALPFTFIDFSPIQDFKE